MNSTEIVQENDAGTIKLIMNSTEIVEEENDDAGTNMLILPSNKKKTASAVVAPLKKEISKRKRRALEAVAKKKALQAQRSDVLASLSSMRLSAEHRALMVPSSYSMKTKKEETLLQQRRKEAGLEVDEPAPKKPKKDEQEQVAPNEGLSAWAKKRSLNAAKKATDAALAAESNKITFQALPGMKNFMPRSTTKPSMEDHAENIPPAFQSGGSTSSTAVPDIREEPRSPVHKAEPLDYPRTERPTISRLERVEVARHQLPAVQMEQEIVESVLENDVIVLCGDTGCGKSTQVPQFLYEAGFASETRKIAITQPRRVAAVSICQRVAQELNDPKLAEYQVRYERSRRVGRKEDVRMKFMTDGILLREVQGDFMLRKYGVVIIDEAHERSVNCDILIGLLSRVVSLRREEYRQKKENSCPLKLIIMSATLRLCDFTENARLFATPPPVVSVDAKTFPVTVHFDRQTEEDYVEAAAKKVREIHKRLPPGSILVFVTGKKEVHRLCQLLDKRKRRKGEDKNDSDEEDDADFDDNIEMSSFSQAPKFAEMKPTTEAVDEPIMEETAFALEENDEQIRLDGEEDKDPEAKQKRVQMNKLDRSRTCRGLFAGGDSTVTLKVLPLYAQLPAREQLEVFNSPEPNQRIVVVATNVAETSITIPNVRYVVDGGKEKKRRYNQSTGVSRFAIQWVSKASANQRAGRSGRVGPGHCYRLYSSAVFNDNFAEFPPISILSTPIDSTLLFLGSLGIPDIMQFPWPTPPHSSTIQFAANRLLALGAVDEKKRVTTLGKRISVLPVAPRYGKMLLEAVRISAAGAPILDLVCIVVAGLSVSNLFALDGKVEKMPHWTTLQDDVEAVLWAILGFAQNPEYFCKAHMLQPKQMEEARDLSNQLALLLNTKLQLSKWKLEMSVPLCPSTPTAAQLWSVRECVLQGFIDHIGIHSDEEVGKYQTSAGAAFIHPNSNCARRRPRPRIVAFNEVIQAQNGKKYLEICVSIDATGLGKALASDEFASPLIKKGELLKTPHPRYCPKTDRVVGFAAPVYVPLDYQLPAVEVPLKGDDAVRIFAKAFLEGKVCTKLTPFVASLKPEALQQVLNLRRDKIVEKLGTKCSRAECEVEWRTNGRFLLDEYLSLVSPKEHSKIQDLWPPI